MYIVARRTDENEIYHHGIKGQRWGVRRFQKKDGSLTQAGKKRYLDDSNTTKRTSTSTDSAKSNHRQKLEKKYISQGMTEQEAKIIADRRIRTEKYIAASAVVTVAACAGYYAYRKYAIDQTISKSANFQRIMKMEPGQEIRPGPQYLAYKNSDRTKYQGLLGKSMQDDIMRNEQFNPLSTGRVKVMKFAIKPQDDVKVASPKRVKDTFEKLYKNNAEFKSAVDKSNKEMYDSVRFGSQGPLYKQVLDKTESSKSRSFIRGKMYDAFNVGLVNKSDDGSKAANIFYNELRKQGVNAIQDINDKKYSGYNSKNPIIMFGGKYDYSGNVMSKDAVARNLNKAQNLLIKDDLIKEGKKSIAMFGSTGFMMYSITNVANKQAINRYRTEHPNTNKSDKEILQILTAGRV